MKKPALKNSIGKKLLKYVFLSYCLVAILLTVIHMVWEYSRATEEIKSTLRLYQPLFEKTLSNEVWHLDLQQLNMTVDGIFHLPEIVGVAVYGPKENYILRKGIIPIAEKNKKRMEIIKEQPDHPNYATDLFQHHFDIVSDSKYGQPEKLGVIYFYSDTHIAFSKVAGLFKSIIFLALIKTIILWGIFLFFSRHLLSKPLNTLMDRMIRFSETQTGEPFLSVAKGKNEVELIGKTFSEISDRLGNAMTDIKKGNIKLRTISSIFEISSTSKDITDLLKTILQEIINNPWLDPKKCSVKGGCISLFQHGTNQPIVKASIGLPLDAVEKCTHENTKSRLCSESEKRKKILFSPTLQHHNIAPDEWAGPSGYYSIPILSRTGKEVVGVMTCFVQGVIHDIEEDRDFLSSIAHSISTLIEQKIAADEEERYQNYLKTIMNNAQDGIVSIDRQGLVVDFNPAAERLFGYTLNEIKGQDIAQFIIPLEFRQAHWDALARHSKTTGKPPTLKRRVEVPGLRADGTTIDLSVAFTSVYRGGELYFTAFIQNITDRKNFLRSLEETLSETKSASQFKSEFLANMSHEIRTPMNAVLGLTHLCLQTDISSQQYDYLNKIHNSANALLRIINDILDFSKIEAGKLEIEIVPFHLDDVLSDLSTLITIRTQRKDLEVVFSTARGVPRNLRGDPTRLGQILTNLTNNAVKFTRSGEIVLSIEQLSEEKTGTVLKFSVRDTGIGMTPDQVDRLFQAFTQADSGTTRKYGGTGLGLTISKRLVELMGGTIWIESTPNQGSTFFFTIRFGVQKEVKRADMRLPKDLLKKRVLVVDDNQTSQNMLSTALESFSLQVTLVSTGMAGLIELEKMRKEGKPFDLLLLDWRMPSLDGVQIFHCLSSLETPFNTPTVFMAPHTEQAEIRHQIGNIQPEAYLDKPVQLSALFEAVMTLFGKANLLPVTEGKEKMPSLHAGETMTGARVLLVEDNEINQQVGKELLEMAHLVVEIAHNGQEAVQRVAETKFELVLMDIQMPVMDGYQATREIRKIPNRANLPIVAMTANVMVQDLAHCWDVGMNGHVAKPIDPKKLFHTLQKWIKPRKKQVIHKGKAASKENKHTIVEESFPSMLGIHIEYGLSRVAGNVKLFRSLLTKFAEDHANWVEEMQKSVEKEDTERAHRMAHTLKGVAGTIGALRLQSMARELESSLRVTPDFRNELTLVLDSIRKLQSPTPEEGEAKKNKASVMDNAALLNALEQLKPHIKKHRPKDCQPILEELACMAFPPAIEYDMENLAKRIKKYRMKEALSILDSLVTQLTPSQEK